MPKTNPPLNQPVQKEEQKGIFDTAIIISALPGVLYLCTYLNESASNAVFGIPVEFVSVTLTKVLINAGLAFTVLASIIFYIVVTTSIIRPIVRLIGGGYVGEEIVTSTSFSIILFCIVISQFLGVVAPNLSQQIIYTLGSIFAFLLLALSSFLGRNGHPIENLVLLFISRPNLKRFYLLLILTIPPILFGLNGAFNAYRQEDFIRFDGSKQVLIKKYDDILISKIYDEKTNNFFDSIVITKVGDSHSFKFKPVHLHRIVPK